MESEYWESRYQSGDMPWEKGAPSPGLVDFLASRPGLPRGRVCVPGCGTGHDVLAWAKAGWAAVGFDLAPSAVQLANERLAAAGVGGEVCQGDFLSDRPPHGFGWLFEHTLFCAIDPRRRDDYTAAVLRWLEPGGQYLAVNYLIEDQEGPPFGTTEAEVVRRFEPHFELVTSWVPRSYPNRAGLEKMFWWRRKP
jgi:SAM-dependent methyltransferase